MAKRAMSAAQVAALSNYGTHRVADHLYLQIKPQGSRSWLFRYRRDGKTRWHGLGPVSLVPLREARETVEELRVAMRKHGIDPVEDRKAQKAEAAAAKINVSTFAWCAEQYIETHRAGWKNQKHIDQWESTLKTYAGPVIGKMAVDQITVDNVLKILKPIWVAKPETASRLRGRIEKVLGWATAKGYRSGENPARWQGGAISHLLPAIGKVQKIEHHASVPYAELPNLMALLGKLDSISAKALQFTILTAARTGETLGARWSEIDLGAGTWTIPGERMKAGVEHRVALSNAAIDLLKSMLPSGAVAFPGALVFPNPKGKPLSNMAMIMVLRGLRDDRPTVHGFRATFSTWAREQTDHPREIIEASLAHQVGNAVERAYGRTDWLAKRRGIAVDWADFCSGQ